MQIPPVIRLLPVIFGILACSLPHAVAEEVDFIQISDFHIFEPKKDDVEGNKEALRWCINQINARLDAKADYKFIVFTGDLGLEGLPGRGDEKEQKDLVEAAKQLAAIVKDSKVKQWLFLPGNNDLDNERPATIENFHKFISALQQELSGKLTIVDFCPQKDKPQSGIYDEDTCRFIGFNNASFKSNDSATDAGNFEQSQLENVKEVLTRLAAPGNFKYAYVFYHIPEIDDPFYASLDSDNPGDEKKLKKREETRGVFGKDFPYSAWTVAPEVRAQWNEVAKNEKVRGLFAGHFHFPKRETYEGVTWVRGSNYLSGSLLKLYICPAVASKRQASETVQARGFREVSIDCDSGQIKSKIFWYEKNRGPQPQLVGPDLALSVDPTTNTASGLLYLSNPTDKEISLSLSADDFKSQTSGLGLNTKVVFAAPAQSTGAPVYEATLPAGKTAPVKVDLSNFVEAGEAIAHLYNFGQPIGMLRAAKWRPAFTVKIMSATPDKPKCTFTKNQPRQITLKNDDAMTYPVSVAAEVDGIWSAAARVTLTPNGSASLDVNPRNEWFPRSAAVKESIRDGTIKIQWPAPGAATQSPEAERIIPFEAHLNSVGEFWQSFWGYLFVLGFLTVGGVCSMLLSNWVPNRLSRADVEEQLNDLANRTHDLSAKIDSGLRVFLRVERNRVYRLLRSRWIFSANFPDIAKQCSDKLSVLSKQIDLATQLDRARLYLAHALERNPIAAKVEVVDCELQKAADLLCRSEPTSEDLDAAKALIVGAVDKISKMDETDSQFATNLLARIASLKTYLDAGAQTAALTKLKELCPTPFSVFATFSTATVLLPEQYAEVDRVTSQLLVIRDYQAYYNANKMPPFPEQDECVKHLQTDTIAGLRRARLVLKQIREGIFVRNIVEAIQDGKVKILVEPPPVEDGLTKFSIRFDSDKLNTAAAQEEVRCEWDFGHDGLTETGWEAFHYFPKMKPRLFSRGYAVCAKFFHNGSGIAVGPDKKPSLQEPIAVRRAARTSSADRNLAEFVRLAIALTIALIGLLAGAREQLVKLDLIAAAIAVFILGFGADTIKNLISPKQAQK